MGVVAGHAGSDPGAVCNDGVTEADVNLIIAREVEQLLARKGYHVDLLDEYDDCIQAQIESTRTPRDAVPRALLCRYLKRITAHLMNVLTSLVMPFDRLDYYDEAKADRD